MPPVILHQPVEGLNRGDTYSGPNEDWLVANGYASREKGSNVTSGSAKNDLSLAVNREGPDEQPPQPKNEVTLVDGNPAAYQKPVVPDELDSTQPRQKEIDAKWKEVEEGKRDPNVPDVVLADAHKAAKESRDYDGSVDDKVRKRQEAEAKAEAERQQKFADERTKKANADARKRNKDNDLDVEHVEKGEDRKEENGVGTDAEVREYDPKKGEYGESQEAKEIGDTPRHPLLDQLPNLDPKKSVFEGADVTKAPSRKRSK